MPKPYLEVKHAVELCGSRTECKRCPYNELGSEWNRWACSMRLMWDVLYWLDELEPAPALSPWEMKGAENEKL